MLEFTLFKIPVRVEPVFWITIGLIGFLSYQKAGDQMFLLIALFIIAGFLSILIHELGHALMVKKYNRPTQIVLSSFGGYATHPAGSLDRKQSFLMTLAGPLLQAIVGVATLFITPHLGFEGTLMLDFLITFSWISIIWAIFNCLPVLPMAGGRMLEAALGPRRIKLTLTISLISAIALCILGFYLHFMFAGIFMAMFAFQNYQALEKFK